jgi:hypothetical protein
MAYTQREMRTVALPDGKEIQVFLSPCVSVIVGNNEMAKAIESAIHDALRDDPRYLFVTLMADGFEPGWKLAVQWGTEPECRKLPELRLSNDEHSPAHVVWRVKQELKKFGTT